MEGNKTMFFYQCLVYYKQKPWFYQCLVYFKQNDGFISVWFILGNIAGNKTMVLSVFGLF